MNWRRIIRFHIPEYQYLWQKLYKAQHGTKEYKDSDRDLSEYLLKIREDLYSNYYVHTDSITGARLDNPDISLKYLSWLKHAGKKEVLEKTEVEIPLERHFFHDDSDWPVHVGSESLAFQGGPQYDKTIYWLSALLRQEDDSNYYFEVDHYLQDGIIRAEVGSSKLLAHVLLGEKKVKPRRLLVVDCQPDSELNLSLVGIENLMEACSRYRYKKYREHGSEFNFSDLLGDRSYLNLNADYPDQSDEEYISLVKSFWNCLQMPKNSQLKHCFYEALKAKFLLWSNCGSVSSRYQTIYDLVELLRELHDLMTRSSLNLRSEFFLDIRSLFQNDVSTTLEEWFFKEYSRKHLDQEGT